MTNTDGIKAVDHSESILRVSNTSPPASLASAISHAVHDGSQVTLRCIGAASVNQGIKGIAIARGYVAQRGHDLVCAPGFTTVQMSDGDVSAITLRVFIA